MSPEDVARAELDAWNRLDVDAIVSYFALDAVWANGPFGHFVGRDAIRRSAERWTALATSADHEILTMAVSDNDVLMERIDTWVIDGRRWVTPVMGVLEIRGDEIAAWREYFHTPGGAGH